MEKVQYLKIKRIIDMVLTYEGVIFGGAVRDGILHDLAASEYYAEIEHTPIIYLQWNPLSTSHLFEPCTPPDTYENDFPKYKDRFVIPHDIDCFMLRHHFDEFITKLMRSHFVKMRSGKYSYFNPDSVGNYTMYLITVLDVITIDCIVQEDNAPLLCPSVKVDYDVNSLLRTKQGIFLMFPSPNKYENEIVKYNIFKHIQQKKANGIASVALRRHKKMIEYGWDIHLNYQQLIFTTEPYKGDCIICHESGSNFKHMTRYSQCKCDLRFCFNCIRTNVAQLHNCPLCKKVVIVNEDLILRELDAYTYILDIKEQKYSKICFKVALERWKRAMIR